MTKKEKVQEPDWEAWPIPKGEICEMHCSASHTYLCVWSPMARQARALIYEAGEGGKPALTIQLSKHSDGTFSASVGKDLRGYFYTFRVQYEDGRWGRETPGIFAKAVSVNGLRAQILDLCSTNPQGWESDARPPLGHPHDAVIYEMHHRDFSIDASSGIQHKGKYLALTEHGTTNGQGENTGVDHLVELGVTHVHLLPSFDFGSIDEAELDRPQYNWGYDPVNYNVPEGSYCTNPYNPSTRIREFKEMVMALHRAGIRVVMDVVYNHVFDLKNSNFERTAPGYFFRWNEDGTPANGSGCGNETASERPMMRRFMIESVMYWTKEYHIDGFRFDLMGIHDIETMNAIRRTLNAIDPSILIYGEGWAAETPRYDADKLAMKHHMAIMPGVAAFGDEMRDGLRGGLDNDKKGAFLVGIPGNEESVKFGLAGASPCKGVDVCRVNYCKHFWSISPQQMIAYVSCHDDLCLADRIKLTLAHMAKGEAVSMVERVRLQKLAYAIVMASRGIPFIWCGDEFMRDRKGVRNCYQSSDSINAIPWGLKSVHKDVFDYLKRLIALRRTMKWYHYEYNFLPVDSANVIALQAHEWVFVFNSNRKCIKQVLPNVADGTYHILLESDGKAMMADGVLEVPAQSAVILSKV